MALPSEFWTDLQTLANGTKGNLNQTLLAFFRNRALSVPLTRLTIENETIQQTLLRGIKCAICAQCITSPSISVPCVRHADRLSIHFHTDCVKAFDVVNWTCPHCRRVEHFSLIMIVPTHLIMLRQLSVMSRFFVRGFSWGFYHFTLSRLLLGSFSSFSRFLLYFSCHQLCRFLSASSVGSDVSLTLLTALLDSEMPFYGRVIFIVIREAWRRVCRAQNQFQIQMENQESMIYVARKQSLHSDLMLVAWGLFTGFLVSRQQLFTSQFLTLLQSSRNFFLHHLKISKLT